MNPFFISIPHFAWGTNDFFTYRRISDNPEIKNINQKKTLAHSADAWYIFRRRLIKAAAP